MLRKICYTIIRPGKKFYLHRFVGKKSYPPSQMVGASGAQRKYQPQFGEKEPATRERERKKSRLGQTKYTWFSTYF